MLLARGGALVLASDEWASGEGREALAEIVAHAQSANDFARTLKTDACPVVDRGIVVHQYGETSRPTNIHSMRQNNLGVLMSIAYDRNDLDLD